MSGNFKVVVPYKKKTAYKLYANGIQADRPVIDKNEEYITFFFLRLSVAVLFYTFRSGWGKRAYVVTNRNESKNTVSLPGLTENLQVLFSVRGRRFELLKRTVYVLLDTCQNNPGTVFMLPDIFWYRLGCVINQFGGKKTDVLILLNNFITGSVK